MERVEWPTFIQTELWGESSDIKLLFTVLSGLNIELQQLTDNVQLNLPSQRAWQWEQLAGSCWTDDLHPSQFIFQVIETVFHRSHQQIVALIYFLLFINHLCLFWTHCSTTTGTQKRHRLSKMVRIQRALEWFTDLFEPLPFYEIWKLFLIQTL